MAVEDVKKIDPLPSLWVLAISNISNHNFSSIIHPRLLPPALTMNGASGQVLPSPKAQFVFVLPSFSHVEGDRYRADSGVPRVARAAAGVQICSLTSTAAPCGLLLHHRFFSHLLCSLSHTPVSLLLQRRLCRARCDPGSFERTHSSGDAHDERQGRRDGGRGTRSSSCGSPPHERSSSSGTSRTALVNRSSAQMPVCAWRLLLCAHMRGSSQLG